MATPRKTCLLCGRAYSHNATPQWAFTRDGQLAGTVHAKCRRAHVDRHTYLYSNYAPEQLALVRAYLSFTLRHAKTVYRSDAWYAAVLLLHGDAETPNDTQEQILAHWQQEPHHLAAARIGAILIAYRGLVQGYAAWRASL